MPHASNASGGSRFGIVLWLILWWWLFFGYFCTTLRSIAFHVKLFLRQKRGMLKYVCLIPLATIYDLIGFGLKDDSLGLMRVLVRFC